MKPELRAGLPILAFADARAFEAWLAEQGTEVGLWLKIAKKTAGIPTVTYAEAVEVALCYGWIDGQKQAYDERYFLQRFTPRRSKSVWSKINVEKVEALIKAEKMRPAGLAAVEAAKADGRWAAAYDSARTMTMDDDFAAALEANPKAKAFWQTLNKTNRYAFNYRVQSAKKPETRQARIEKFIAMLHEGKVLY